MDDFRKPIIYMLKQKYTCAQLNMLTQFWTLTFEANVLEKVVLSWEEKILNFGNVILSEMLKILNEPFDEMPLYLDSPFKYVQLMAQWRMHIGA